MGGIGEKQKQKQKQKKEGRKHLYIYLSKRGKWALKIKRNRMARETLASMERIFYLANVVIIVVIVVKVVGKSKINQNREFFVVCCNTKKCSFSQ